MIHKNFDHFSNFIIDAEGRADSYNIKSPLAINTFRLDIYQESWDIIQIYFFEAFIVFSLKYGNGFYYQHKRLVNDLNLTDYTVRKNKENLTELGFISHKRTSKKSNYKTKFTVEYDLIIQKISSIYNFSMFQKDVRKRYKDLYINLYKYYRDKSSNSNIQDRKISEADVKEMVDETILNTFKDFADDEENRHLV